MAGSYWPYPCGGQTLLRIVEDSAEGLCLTSATRDERDARGVVDHGEGERDAAGRGLRRVVDVRDPAVLLREERVAGEERGGVAVGADAEEDEVKDGEARRLLLRELPDELLLVRVRELLEVVELVRVDRVDVLGGNGHLRVERALGEEVVRVGVVERDDTLVGVEDVPVETMLMWLWKGLLGYQREGHSPLVPLHARLSDERGKGLCKRSTRNGDGEPAALVNRFPLGLENVLRERIR